MRRALNHELPPCGHSLRPLRTAGIVLGLLAASAGSAAAAAPGAAPESLYLMGIPVDFILFALTLLGVALFHHHTLQVALTGLAARRIAGPIWEMALVARALRVGNVQGVLQMAHGFDGELSAAPALAPGIESAGFGGRVKNDSKSAAAYNKGLGGRRFIRSSPNEPARVWQRRSA
mgnify:CR=1 FL=1